jgi:hypothetical protein
VTEAASDGSWGPLRDELEADVRRVADRLRNLSLTRLAGPVAPPEPGGRPYGSRAQAARDVAQALADTARALEAPGAGGPAPRREVPVLADHAAGDQVAVTGRDLLAAMLLVRPGTEVQVGEAGRGPAREAVERVSALLADLRRRL